MSDRRPLLPPPSMALGRWFAAGGLFVQVNIILLMIYLRPTLADNDLFKMLAQAIVVQGFVGLALAFLFTSGGGDQRRDGT